MSDLPPMKPDLRRRLHIAASLASKAGLPMRSAAEKFLSIAMLEVGEVIAQVEKFGTTYFSPSRTLQSLFPDRAINGRLCSYEAIVTTCSPTDTIEVRVMLKKLLSLSREGTIVVGDYSVGIIETGIWGSKKDVGLVVEALIEAGALIRYHGPRQRDVR